MPTFNPNAGREYPAARIDYVGDNSIFETYDHGAFNIIEAVTNAVLVGSSEAIERFRAFAQGVVNLEHSSKSQLAQVHSQVAEGMQAATVLAYKAAHARGRNNSPYRLSTRDAGGRMLAALENPLFVRGTYDGIGFVNVTLLDAEARQWHRLNFGARGSRGGGALTGMHTATWDGLVIGAFGFSDESPSAGFSLPKGIWISEGGERVPAGGGSADQFYPQSQRGLLKGRGILGRPAARRRTAGIKAWNFFDAGVKELAETIGPAYGNLYSNWFASAVKGVGPLSTQINLPPPRRTPLKVL